MYSENHLQFMQVAYITLSDVDNYFLRKDGYNSATNDIDIGTHKLINVADPTNHKMQQQRIMWVIIQKNLLI